jgi:arabinofuranosyltransferase
VPSTDLNCKNRSLFWADWICSAAPIVALVAVAALMLVHAHRYVAFLSDDALISLRYASRFVEGHGLSWTGQERVEGYTDFGWVMLVAAGRRLGFDAIRVALIFDHLGVLLAIAVCGWSARTGRLLVSRLVMGGGLLAASVPMAVWANGGLEHGLMTGVLAFSIYRLQRVVVSGGGAPVWPCGFALALLVSLRADGLVLVSFALGAALLPGLVARDRARTKWILQAASAPVAALVGQGLFRRLYFGQWWPQTALVKVSLNGARLALGLRHVGQGYLALAVLLMVAMAATVLLVRRREHAALLVPWSVAIGWSTYLAAVGGDIFPGWRQLLLGLVPLALVAAEMGEQIGSHRLLLIAPLSLGLAALHLNIQLRDSENQRAAHELWEWDGRAVGPLLKQAFGQAQPLLAVDAAGALPYWSELPSLDMLGLNDSYIAHHPPPNFGRGAIGHELGDGAYVLGRAPDLIAFNSAAGARDPEFLSGREMLAMPVFHQLYQWVRLQASTGNRAFAELWVRRDGKVGVVRDANRIEIPGFLFTGQASDATARLDGTGKLAAEISAAAPGALPPLEIPSGRWHIEAVAGGELVLGLRCNDRSVEGVAPGPRLNVDLDRAMPIELAVAPASGVSGLAHLTRVIFTRITEPAPPIHCVSADRRPAVSLRALAHPKPEGLVWNHPGNFVIGTEGVAIEVDADQRVRHLDLSVDENDSYAIEIFHRGASAWRTEVPPRPLRGGLALHHLDLPVSVSVASGDTIVVTPLAGDGFYSIGDLRLSE